MEASSVNLGVWKLRDNEVDTTHFFSTRDTWKDKDKLLGWVRRQANRAGLRLSLKDLVKVEILCRSWFVNEMASTKYEREK